MQRFNDMRIKQNFGYSMARSKSYPWKEADLQYIFFDVGSMEASTMSASFPDKVPDI